MDREKRAAEWHGHIKANVERFMRHEINHAEFSANQATLWGEIASDPEVNERVGQLLLDELRAARIDVELTRVVVAADQGAARWGDGLAAAEREPMAKSLSEHIEHVAQAQGLSDVFSLATSKVEGRTAGGKAFALIALVGDDEEVGGLVEAFEALEEDGDLDEPDYDSDARALRDARRHEFDDLDEPDEEDLDEPDEG